MTTTENNERCSKPMRILCVILGVLIGIGGMRVAWKLMAPAPPPPATSAIDPGAVTRLKAELTEARNRIRQLEERNTELSVTPAVTEPQARAVAPAAKPAETNEGGIFAKMFGGGGDTNRVAAMRKVMETAMKQQQEVKVTGLKLRLHLSDAQETQIRDVLNRQFDMIAKAMDGKAPKEDMAKSESAYEDEIKNILTGDQLGEYEKYKVEQRQSQAQMSANVELSQLQPLLQLDQAQQDKVFQALYNVAEKQAAQYASGATPPSDPIKIIEQQFEDKKTALRPLLTPEQFAALEKHLDSQRDMIRAFMPAVGKDTDKDTDAPPPPPTVSRAP